MAQIVPAKTTYKETLVSCQRDLGSLGNNANFTPVLAIHVEGRGE